MHYAVSHGNFDVVSILLDSKVCDVNQMNNAGYTSVMLVSLAKLKNSAHRTVVQRLFQMADVNIRAKKVSPTIFLFLPIMHLVSFTFLALPNCPHACSITWKFGHGGDALGSWC